MSIDAGPLGNKVLELIGDLEELYGPDARLVDAMIVVEVSHPAADAGPDVDDDDPDPDAYSSVHVRVLSGRSTVGYGLADRALEAFRDS